ncbi:hypothetical protein Tco_1298603 [Tanacetum coccineum]
MIATTVNPTPTFNHTPTVTPSPIPTFNPTPTVTPTHTPNFTPSSSKRKFTKTSAYRRNKNVIDMEPVHLLANVNVQESEPLPANANTTQNETVESIIQELLSMNYEFDPFEDNMTTSINDQPSVNEQERDRGDNYEPVEPCRFIRIKDFRAKSAALNQVKGDYSQQYTMLRDYCLELKRTNPVTTIKIEVERDSDTDLQTRVSCKGQKDPMNATGTSTSQRSTNAAADTRKRPSDAGNAPANKKQATTSSNAGTIPSTAPAKKKQAAIGSGQKRMTRSGSVAAQKQKKNEKRPI